MTLRTSAAAVVGLTLLAACAAATSPRQPARMTEYVSPVVLLVSPDSAEIARMRHDLGGDFYTVADDGTWYQAEARTLLDSLHIPYADVSSREARFRVGGVMRRFAWRPDDLPWYAVVYDGTSAPAVAPVYELRDHLPRTLLGPAGR
jgi:hypothetical protein